MNTLSNDIARCKGIGDEKEGFYEECVKCLRRTSPRNGDRTVWMKPPPIIALWCEYLIELEKEP
jgi:hypothetical protein